MSMFIVYLKDHDGHQAGKEYCVERSLARRLCETKVAVPLSEHLKMELEKEKQAEKLIEKAAEQKIEKAISLKAKKRNKNIKK